MQLIHPLKITAADQPDLRPVAPGKYMLFGNYNVAFNFGDNFCTVRVPDGTRSDGASVPRWLWGLFGLRPDGLHRAAALVHDYLCSNKGSFTNLFLDVPYKVRLSSKQTHALFAEMLHAAGVPRFRAKLMAQAVRLFGPRWAK